MTEGNVICVLETKVIITPIIPQNSLFLIVLEDYKKTPLYGRGLIIYTYFLGGQINNH